MREAMTEWSAEAESQAKNSGRQARRDPAFPARKDVAGQRMRLFSPDVLRDRFRGWQPVRLIGFANVILSLRAQKSAEPHGQDLTGAIVLGFGLDTDLVGLAVALDRGEHLGGIEQAVLHGGILSDRRDGR